MNNQQASGASGGSEAGAHSGASDCVEDVNYEEVK